MPQPETKEKAITEYTKALRKPLLNEGWQTTGHGVGQHPGDAEEALRPQAIKSS